MPIASSFISNRPLDGRHQQDLLWVFKKKLKIVEEASIRMLYAYCFNITDSILENVPNNNPITGTHSPKWLMDNPLQTTAFKIAVYAKNTAFSSQVNTLWKGERSTFKAT